MRQFLVCLLLLTAKLAKTQNLILPGDKSLQVKWLKQETYSMKWYMIRDTMKQEAGEITTTVTDRDKKIYIIQRVQLKRRSALWTDSTVAEAGTLAPLYHSSYNVQRNMTLNFKEGLVDGYYHSNIHQGQTAINDSIAVKCFDSNLFPSILTCLPLKEGYAIKIPLYDYNNTAKHGIVYAMVNTVRKAWYKRKDNIYEPVFILNVFDEISNDFSIYYISQATRAILEINTGSSSNCMQLIRS